MSSLINPDLKDDGGSNSHNTVRRRRVHVGSPTPHVTRLATGRIRGAVTKAHVSEASGVGRWPGVFRTAAAGKNVHASMFYN